MLPARVTAKGVGRDVAGDVLVAVDDLRTKLGESAWRTLQALWSVRDQAGLTHATRDGIADLPGFQPIGASTAMKALARLREAALIRPIGWTKARVPSGASVIEREVYMREVRGAVALGAAAGQLIVPAETSAWMSSASSWGGRRSGAGRPSSRIQDGSTPLANIEFKTGRPNSRGVDPRPLDDNQEGSPMNKKRRDKSAQGVSGLRPETSAAGAAPLRGVSGTPEGPKERPEAIETPPRSPNGAGAFLVAPGGPRPAPRFAGLGSSLGAPLAPRPQGTPTGPADGVPPFPGASLIAPATLPSPPLLDEKMGDLERADMLAVAFRAAAESRFGGRCWAFRGGPLMRSKFYSLLVDAAQTLLDLEFSPAAWCAFSCDVWKKHADERGRKVKHPPVQWVFNASRIVERRGWFRAEEDNYAGGRIIYGPKHKALLGRYALMRAELLRRQEPVATIVARYFPNWERTITDVRAEVAELQQDLRARAERGEFLW
jgi:hypothetical protein